MSSPPNTAGPKVLHFRQSSQLWGPDRFILDLCRTLPAHGFQCEIAILYRRGPSEPLQHPILAAAKAQGTPVVQMDGRWRSLAGVLRRLRRKLEEENFSVLHCHEYKTDIVGAIGAWGISRQLLGRVATVRHTELGWRMRLFQWLDGLALDSFDRLTVPSRGALQELAPHPHLLARARVVYHAAEAPCELAGGSEARAIRRAFAAGDGETVISVIGRLEPVKGHRCFLDCARLVRAARPEARFWIVGDGSLRPELEAAASQKGLNGAIAFLGYRTDTARVIEASDIVVVSSLYESFCRVVLEALALAKPVVATSVGGIPEIIRDGDTGLLTPCGDAEQMAGAILRLLADRASAVQMGLRGQQHIRKTFSMEAAAAAMAAVYRQLPACA